MAPSDVHGNWKVVARKGMGRPGDGGSRGRSWRAKSGGGVRRDAGGTTVVRGGRPENVAIFGGSPIEGGGACTTVTGGEPYQGGGAAKPRSWPSAYEKKERENIHKANSSFHHFPALIGSGPSPKTAGINATVDLLHSGGKSGATRYFGCVFLSASCRVFTGTRDWVFALGPHSGPSCWAPVTEICGLADWGAHGQMGAGYDQAPPCGDEEGTSDSSIDRKGPLLITAGLTGEGEWGNQIRTMDIRANRREMVEPTRSSVRLAKGGKSSVLQRAMTRKANLREDGDGCRGGRVINMLARKTKLCGVSLTEVEARNFEEFLTRSA